METRINRKTKKDKKKKDRKEGKKRERKRERERKRKRKKERERGPHYLVLGGKKQESPRSTLEDMLLSHSCEPLYLFSFSPFINLTQQKEDFFFIFLQKSFLTQRAFHANQMDCSLKMRYISCSSDLIMLGMVCMERSLSQKRFDLVCICYLLESFWWAIVLFFLFFFFFFFVGLP